MSTRAPSLAAIDARRSSLGGASDHATPTPDLAHLAVRAKRPRKDGRNVVIHVEQGKWRPLPVFLFRPSQVAAEALLPQAAR
jgi:hypothetical protein